jgi:HPt (histidine-containing phosphotransfer) domain-containing protein
MLALESAREKFRMLIVDRILAFEAFQRSAGQPKELAGALTNIQNLAHKIAGVGATLGYSSAGALACSVEQIVQEGREGNLSLSVVWSNAQPRLETLLVELESILDNQR